MNQTKTQFTGTNKHFNYIKQNYPNVYAVLISVALMLWFRGGLGVIDYLFIPKHELRYYILCISLGIGILYMNDFSLSELHVIDELPTKNNPRSSHHIGPIGSYVHAASHG